jgi:hypothetical protein
MAGFLDQWRKPSKRLLQDVKTKSIERTLLPLIKQVRSDDEFSLFIHGDTKEVEMKEKSDEKVILMNEICENVDDDVGMIFFCSIILACVSILRHYPARLSTYVCKLSSGVWMKGFFFLFSRLHFAHSSYHNFSFFLSRYCQAPKKNFVINFFLSFCENLPHKFSTLQFFFFCEPLARLARAMMTKRKKRNSFRGVCAKNNKKNNKNPDSTTCKRNAVYYFLAIKTTRRLNIHHFDRLQ